MGIETILQVGGMALSAKGAYDASRASKAAYNAQGQISENNAQIADWQAEDAIARGEVTAKQVASKGRQLKGSQRAALAANGVDLGVGSALAIQNDTDYFTQVDKNTALDNAQREAWGYKMQAQNFANDGSMLRSRADSESPWMAASTSLLTGAGKVASTWYKNTGSTPAPDAYGNFFYRSNRGSGD